MPPTRTGPVPTPRRRSLTFLVTLLLLVSTAGAVAGSEPDVSTSSDDPAAVREPAVPEGEAHVEGIVVSQGTWGGIANATLTVTNSTGATSTHQVQDDGTFRLVLDPGEHTLTADAPQHFAATETRSFEGGQRDHVRFGLEPHPARLHLHVEDPEGDPLEDVTVSAWTGRTTEEARTDGNGTAVLDLTVGQVHLRMEDPRTDACRALTRTLGGNATWTLTLPPAPPRDATVRGTATDPRTGDPVAGAHVTFYQDRYVTLAEDERAAEDDAASTDVASVSSLVWEGPRCHREPVTVTTSTDGSYEVDLPNGSYQVTARHPDHLPDMARVDAGVDSVVTLDIRLPSIPSASVPVDGRLVDADGEGVGPGEVLLRNVQWGTYTHARVDADGRWNATVVPGYTHVTAYVRTACHPTAAPDVEPRTEPHPVVPDKDGCNPEHHPVTVTRVYEEGTQPTEVLTMPGVQVPATILEGYVVNASSGEPVPGARLHVRNLDTYGWGTARTDADGSYRIRVNPGTHHVSAYGAGFLPWQGTVEVPHPDARPGARPLDVELTPGQPRYDRGCCLEVMDGQDLGSTTGEEPEGSDGAVSGDDLAPGATSTRYPDLGGGLGTYDAAERARVLSSYEGQDQDEVPGPGLAALLALLGGIAVARGSSRRRR